MRKLGSKRHHGTGSAGAARENTSILFGPPSLKNPKSVREPRPTKEKPRRYCLVLALMG